MDRTQRDPQPRVSNKALDVVRRLFAAVEERDLTAMLDLYADDVEIREADSLPYGGTYHGHEGAAEHGRGYVETWGPLQRDGDAQMDAEFHALKDVVVVRWTQRARSSTGAPRAWRAISVYHVEDGTITTSQMFYADDADLKAFLDERAGTE